MYYHIYPDALVKWRSILYDAYCKIIAASAETSSDKQDRLDAIALTKSSIDAPVHEGIVI